MTYYYDEWAGYFRWKGSERDVDYNTIFLNFKSTELWHFMGLLKWQDILASTLSLIQGTDPLTYSFQHYTQFSETLNLILVKTII